MLDTDESRALAEAIRHTLRPTAGVQSDVVDELKVVSICGGRGTGKTTLLRNVSTDESIFDGATLLLPIIEPDLLTPHDSVVSAVVQAMRRQLRAAGRLRELVHVEELDSEITMAELCVRMSRRVAVARATEYPRYRSIDDLASDSHRAMEATSNLVEEWVSFCGSVASNGTVLIRIDDLDLAARRAGEVLEDIRILAAAPNAVVVVALDLEEIRRTLFADRLARDLDFRGEEKTLADGRGVYYTPHAIDAVEGLITKLLRPDLRIVLEPIPLRERLDFTPILERDSLGDLLAAILAPNLLQVSNLGGLFLYDDGSGNRVPTVYAECLSSNRRRLTVLHRQLSSILGTPDAVARAARLLIKHGVSEGVRSSGFLGLTEQSFIRFVSDPFGRHDLEIDFTNLLYESGSMRRTHYLDSGLQNHTSRIHAADDGGYEEEHDGGNEVVNTTASRIRLTVRSSAIARLKLGTDKSGGPTVSSSLATSLLLARELAIGGALEERELVVGVPPREGGTRKRLISIEGSDDHFIQIPLWDCYLDYWLLQHLWNSLSRQLDRLHRSPPDVLVLALACLVRAIRQITDQRTVAGIEDWLSSVSAVSDYSAILDEELNRATSTYRKLISSEHVRDRDYVEWYEMRLPMALDPLIVGSQWRGLLDRHRRSIAVVGRWDYVGPQLWGAIETRLVTSAGEEWVDGLVGALEVVAPPEVAQRARRRHERRRQTAAAGRLAPAADHIIASVSAPAASDAGELVAHIRREMAQLKHQAEVEAAGYRAAQEQ